MSTLILNDSIQNIGRAGSGLNGSVAAKLLASGFNANALRTNGTLQKDEWIAFDNTVIDIARKRLVITQDLMSRGLTYSLPNALGHTRLEWETISDMDPAIITMSGLSESQNDRQIYDLSGMPIPIIHKDFNINIRTLAASRNKGLPLDTTQAAVASRKVSETIETMIFNGATVLGANNPIYGLRTAPFRNTGALAESWLTASGEDIVADVLAMMTALDDDNMFGPYALYIGTGVGIRLGEDYKAESDKSIVKRLLEIEGLQSIKTTKDLPAGEVIMVQLTSDVIDLIDGMQPTTLEWDSHGGMITNFKVMAIIVPRLRNDQLGQSGIAHYTAG